VLLLLLLLRLRLLLLLLLLLQSKTDELDEMLAHLHKVETEAAYY
jgi:hypothetical protein